MNKIDLQELVGNVKAKAEVEEEPKILEPINPLYVPEKIDVQVRMGIPLKYRSAKLSDLEGYEDEIKLAREALRADRSLLLWGGVGRGKTHLGVCLTRLVWLEKGGNMYDCPKFISTPDFFEKLKESYSSDTAFTEGDVLDELRKPSILLLDDFGVNKNTEWAVEKLFQVIDYRDRQKKPMVVTSNLDPKRIFKIDEEGRIMSRLKGMGEVIKLDGVDWRLK